jgi:hypothetical protein
MLRIQRTLAILLLAAIALIPAIGCMNLTTAPVMPHIEAPVTASTSHVSGGRVATNNGLLDGVVNDLSGLVGVVTSTVDSLGDVVNSVTIDGSVGGSLTNGRWQVMVPPDAVNGDATVGITVTNVTSNRCELSITPVSKNYFDTPVTLTVDCATVPAGQLRNYTIYWLDPSVGTWVQVDGATVDMTHRTVSAPLKHFSTYCTGPAGGKVGW